VYGAQGIDDIRRLAKEFSLARRNNVNDLICRKYYSCIYITYCFRNNIDGPEDFLRNPHDPDSELSDDPVTKRAIKRNRIKMDDMMKASLKIINDRHPNH
jgi:hypothetical protein